jgi:hypothetical protein
MLRLELWMASLWCVRVEAAVTRMAAMLGPVLVLVPRPLDFRMIATKPLRTPAALAILLQQQQQQQQQQAFQLWQQK